MTEFWDRNGKPLTLPVWAFLYECGTYRCVARDVVVSTVDTSEGFDVSTIWQGIDDGLRFLGAPERPEPGFIYETAVLHGDGLPEEGRISREIVAKWHASTEADARRMHDVAVRWACDHVDAPVVIRDPVVLPRPRAGWNVPLGRPRGHCQACRRLVRLTAGGTVVAHGSRSTHLHPRCRGSRLRPALRPGVTR